MNEELENESKKIDLAFERISPIDYDEVFTHLKDDLAEAIEAMRDFTDRVESGSVKSKITYMKFKALISKHDLKYENHPKDGDHVKTI